MCFVFCGIGTELVLVSEFEASEGYIIGLLQRPPGISSFKICWFECMDRIPVFIHEYICV